MQLNALQPSVQQSSALQSSTPQSNALPSALKTSVLHSRILQLNALQSIVLNSSQSHCSNVSKIPNQQMVNWVKSLECQPPNLSIHKQSYRKEKKGFGTNLVVLIQLDNVYKTL